MLLPATLAIKMGAKNSQDELLIMANFFTSLGQLLLTIYDRRSLDVNNSSADNSSAGNSSAGGSGGGNVES